MLKSVQLVRGSSFRNNLLQNPYFNKVGFIACKAFLVKNVINNYFRCTIVRLLATRQSKAFELRLCAYKLKAKFLLWIQVLFNRWGEVVLPFAIIIIVSPCISVLVGRNWLLPVDLIRPGPVKIGGKGGNFPTPLHIMKNWKGLVILLIDPPPSRFSDLPSAL